MTLSDWIVAGRRPDDMEAKKRLVRFWVREHQGHVPVIAH